MGTKKSTTPSTVAQDEGTAKDGNTMPQYMRKNPRGTGYEFRRGVPVDVREAIGKREFKEALGGDFRSASQRCRELAVETDRHIEAARAAPDQPPPNATKAPGTGCRGARS